MIKKELALRIFEGFSIQRWNDLIRPFDLVEMDKAAEKMVIAYIIGKFEESKGVSIDWQWLSYASLFDLLRKISLCDIKAPVQQLLKKEYTREYLRLDEWVLNQYKTLFSDDDLFSRFTIYVGQKAGTLPIPQELQATYTVLGAAHKYSTMRELQMLSVVNEKERLVKIERELQAQLQPYFSLSGLQKLLTHQRTYDFLLKIEQLRFQTRWNQTPRVPKTSVLGHSFFVAIMTLLLSRDSSSVMCQRRCINNFFSALFHDLPEAVTRDIISPVKQATDALPNIVKQIEDEIVGRELLPLMEPFFSDELSYYTNDEFSNRIKKDGKVKTVTFEELNTLYNQNSFEPIDGKLVRLSDHLAALIEADSSIRHGITSTHLEKGRESMLAHYKEGELINGIDAHSLFRSIAGDPLV
ncbi:MAG: HD domain-containing protein [Treponema sp.]|nr:HD domain-containing protein [Treponema sp.]